MPSRRCSPFRTLDEVIGKDNALPSRLAGCAFLRSASTLHTMTEKLDVGPLGLNGCNLAAAEMPIGGIEDSGY